MAIQAEGAPSDLSSRWLRTNWTLRKGGGTDFRGIPRPRSRIVRTSDSREGRPLDCYSGTLVMRLNHT